MKQIDAPRPAIPLDFGVSVSEILCLAPTFFLGHWRDSLDRLCRPHVMFSESHVPSIQVSELVIAYR